METPKTYREALTLEIRSRKRKIKKLNALETVMIVLSHVLYTIGMGMIMVKYCTDMALIERMMGISIASLIGSLLLIRMVFSIIRTYRIHKVCEMIRKKRNVA